MTYNVSGGMLDFAQSINQSPYSVYRHRDAVVEHHGLQELSQCQ